MCGPEGTGQTQDAGEERGIVVVLELSGRRPFGPESGLYQYNGYNPRCFRHRVEAENLVKNWLLKLK